MKESATLYINVKTTSDTKGIEQTIQYSRQAKKILEDTYNVSPTSKKYEEYINAKKTLDSKSKLTFEEYERLKTQIENSENDKRVKNYSEYKNREKQITEKLAGNLFNIGSKMSLFVTAPLLLVANSAIKSSSKIEDFTASFKTLLGTEAAAKKMVGELQKMASVTPFDPDPLIRGSKTLLAFGVDVDNVKSKLTQIGDMSQGSAEKLESMATAYGKIYTKGKATMEELNILINAGVPILGELSKMTGETTEEIMKMASQGEVSITLIDEAFKNLTSEGGMFYKGMETASQTLSGKLSTLQGNFDMLGASLMEVVLPVIKNIVDNVNNVVVAFQGMDTGTKKLVVGIGAFAIAAGPSIVVISKMITALKALTIEQIKANMAAYANPYVLLAAAIVAVTVAIGAYIYQTSSATAINKRLKENTEELKKLQDEYRGVVDQLTDSTKKLTKEQEINLEAQKTLLKFDISKKIQEIVKDYERLNNSIFGKNKLQDMEEEIKKATDKKDYYFKAIEKAMASTKKEAYIYIGAMKGVYSLKELQRFALESEKNLLNLQSQYQSATKNISESIINLAFSIKNGIYTVQELKLLLPDDLYKKVIEQYNKIKEAKELLNKEEQTKAKPRDIEKEYQEYIKLEEKIKKNKYSQTIDGAQKRLNDEKTLTDKQQDKLFMSYVALKKKEEDISKDSFERIEKNYKKYADNKSKIESNLLSEIEKKALVSENDLLEKDYKLYKEYLEKKEKAEKEKQNGSIQILTEYLDLQKDIREGNFEDIEKYNELVAESEEKWNDFQLDNYIEYLKKKKDLTIEEQKILDRIKSEGVEKKEIDNLDKLSDKFKEVSKVIETSSESLQVEIQTIADAATINFTGIGRLVQNVMSAITIQTVEVINKISNIIEKMEELGEESLSTKDKAIIALSAVSAVMEAGAQAIQAASEYLSEETSKKLELIEREYQQTISNINSQLENQNKKIEEQQKKELENLKKYYEEKGIIIETGYETELEKAQLHYEQMLEEYNEYKESENEERTALLEQIKESLEGKTDKEIEEALKQKELELQTKKEKEKLALEEKVKLSQAELEKQKILEASEKKKEEIRRQAVLKEYKAKVDFETKKHQIEVESFNAKKALDIVNVWVAAFSSIAQMWAQAMTVPPLLWPVTMTTAGIMSGVISTTAGINTGLIAAQEPPPPPILPPPPQFQEGGVIPGQNYFGDNVPILANSAERVLTAQQNELFEKLVYDIANNYSQNQNVQVVVHAYFDSEEIPLSKMLVNIQQKERFRR